MLPLNRNARILSYALVLAATVVMGWQFFGLWWIGLPVWVLLVVEEEKANRRKERWVLENPETVAQIRRRR